MFGDTCNCCIVIGILLVIVFLCLYSGGLLTQDNVVNPVKAAYNRVALLVMPPPGTAVVPPAAATPAAVTPVVGTVPTTATFVGY